MLEAAWWGFVGGAALLLGAAIGVLWDVPHRIVGLVMGFGAGVLFSALAFELTAEAYLSAGAPPVALGLLTGALVYFAGDEWLDRRGAHRRKNPAGAQPDAAASALVLGALLDGIPESAAIGLSLVDGGGVGVAVVTAVFLSNVPEALASSAGMRKAGQSSRHIFGVWALVTLAGTVAAALGYGLLGDADPRWVAATQAFAAGAILTMLADTMLPEAVEHAGRLVGLVTVLGFVSAFLLSVV
ncbi:ZIP family metal transporter [Nocardioides iriomotensis]|uniref:ZIP family zinc transporter n=1 Tax=Nocardioides iriomotensis TaxID=715784 RepID=A0A4Q5J067_9ACTN|nr:ZIP family zinc transporter [Nocardioides iriomotensis]RYU10779.1 ZIP family zinc transporter [Nocardioides iriomotensis]